MTFHALPQLPLTHDRTSDDLSRAPDHSFVRAKFKPGEGEIGVAAPIGG
jgi:hypothetical protein